MPDGNTGIPPDATRSRTGRPRVHGLKTLRRAVTTLTTKRLDGRSAVAVRAWKADVAPSIGRAPRPSPVRPAPADPLSRPDPARLESSTLLRGILSSMDTLRSAAGSATPARA
jgi:hypothetical protein